MLKCPDDRASLAANVDDQANADLYAAGLPAYTRTVSDDEVSIDAENIREDKPQTSGDIHVSSVPANNRESVLYPTPSPPGHTNSRGWEHSEQTTPLIPSSAVSSRTAHYLTEPVTNAALVGVRLCSVLLDRPAIWLVKGKTTALSPLAAAVLVEEGSIVPQNLELSVNNHRFHTKH